MDKSAEEFREAVLDVIRFLADPDEQRTFASRVTYSDYSSEFFFWWFDDFDPETSLYRAAFSETELAALKSFAATYESSDRELGQNDRSIDDLLETPAWSRLVHAARRTVEAVALQPNQSLESTRGE